MKIFGLPLKKKSPKKESTKNKDAAAVEYNLQIMAQTMSESVTADVYHPSHVLVTRNSTAQEKIN
jgi:hypothetical protein